MDFEKNSIDSKPSKASDFMKSTADEDHVDMRISLEQAVSMIEALDFFTRISLGQFEEIASFVRKGRIRPKTEPGQYAGIASEETINQIDRLVFEMKQCMGFSRGQSNGVGHSHNSINSMRAYEIQKALAQAVATRPGSTVPLYSVDRDGLNPGLRYTSDLTPVVTWVQKE